MSRFAGAAKTPSRLPRRRTVVVGGRTEASSAEEELYLPARSGLCRSASRTLRRNRTTQGEARMGIIRTRSTHGSPGALRLVADHQLDPASRRAGPRRKGIALTLAVAGAAVALVGFLGAGPAGASPAAARPIVAAPIAAATGSGAPTPRAATPVTDAVLSRAAATAQINPAAVVYYERTYRVSANVPRSVSPHS
jgi:hypothetical protein